MHDDALEAGDAIAREMLADLEPFRFAEANDEWTRSACFRLRYRALLEFDPAAAALCVGGTERDVFDDGAVLISGRDGDRVIGTCRVIPPFAGLFPIETAFDLQLSDRSGLVEWGRVVVDPDYRGDGSSVFLALAAQGWLSMRARGQTRVIGATPKRLIGLFEALGFTITILGPPRSYWGEARYPILCDAQPTIERLEPGWLAGDEQTGRTPDPG